MHQRNAGESVLQRMRDKPWSTTGFVLGLIPLGVLAFGFWGPEPIRFIPAALLYKVLPFQLATSKAGLVLSACLNAMLFYAVGWFLAWKLTRRQRAGVFTGIFLAMLLPVVMFMVLAIGLAMLWNSMSGQPMFGSHPMFGSLFESHTAPSAAQVEAKRKRREEAAQRTAARMERQQAESAREAADRALEAEYRRMAEEARSAPPQAPQQPVIAPPRAQGEERCVGNQRMRRVDNGWEQAGAC